MRFVPREPADDENVNVTPVHPLRDAVRLGVSIGVVVLVALALLFALADRLAMWISPATEVSVFGGALGSVGSAGDRRLAEVQRVLDGLLEVAPDNGYTYQLRVIEGESNAAAVIGGTILVTTGLLDRVRSENELAFVLAHELGHFAHRDQLRGVSRALLAQLAIGAVFGWSYAGSAGDVFAAAGQLELLRHSRARERAADRFAVELLARRYGQIAGATDFFQRTLRGQGGRRTWLATHPLTSDRIADVERLAREHGWPLDGERLPLWSDPSPPGNSQLPTPNSQ